MKGKDIGNADDAYVDLMDMVKDENVYGIVDDDGCRDCILRLPDYIGGDKEEQEVSLDVLFDRGDPELSSHGTNSSVFFGSGKFERTGLGSDRDCREAANTAFSFLKANGKRISGSISVAAKDYIVNYQDLQGIGMTSRLALPTLIALCSIALGRPVVSTLAVLLPITSAADLGTVPPELVGSFNLIFYSSAEDAVFKALGVE